MGRGRQHEITVADIETTSSIVREQTTEDVGRNVLKRQDATSEPPRQDMRQRIFKVPKPLAGTEPIHPKPYLGKADDADRLILERLTFVPSSERFIDLTPHQGREHIRVQQLPHSPTGGEPAALLRSSTIRSRISASRSPSPVSRTGAKASRRDMGRACSNALEGSPKPPSRRSSLTPEPRSGSKNSRRLSGLSSGCGSTAMRWRFQSVADTTTTSSLP